MTLCSLWFTYLTQPYQKYIQPVYKIAYTQDYWDTTPTMAHYRQSYKNADGVDPDVEVGIDPNLDLSQFTSVSFAYVPAVTEEYVEMTQADFQFNS